MSKAPSVNLGEMLCRMQSLRNQTKTVQKQSSEKPSLPVVSNAVVHYQMQNQPIAFEFWKFHAWSCVECFALRYVTVHKAKEKKAQRGDSCFLSLPWVVFEAFFQVLLRRGMNRQKYHKWGESTFSDATRQLDKHFQWKMCFDQDQVKANRPEFEVRKKHSQQILEFFFRSWHDICQT